jgi:predicted nucleic acid-binding protein
MTDKLVIEISKQDVEKLLGGTLTTKEWKIFSERLDLDLYDSLNEWVEYWSDKLDDLVDSYEYLEQSLAKK